MNVSLPGTPDPRARFRRGGTAVIAFILLGFSGALLLHSANTPAFTVHDKAYYASPEQVDFIRPGLTLKIQSAAVADDGTITVSFNLTDPKGLPLDMAGVVTPGPIAVSFVAGYIPRGQTQYTSYTTRVFTNSKNPTPTTDPWVDSGGTFATTAVGQYTYTFKAKAPAGFDKSVTHSIGGQASRDLTEFDMGKQADNDVFSWVPDGSKVTVTRDVVRTATCNSTCHDPLAVHGSNRRKVEYCVMCHQPQNHDPYTGGSLSFPVLVHKIHIGSSMPSVKAGNKLLINNTDFTNVVFPAGVKNCQVCHDPKSGAAQADAWLKPNSAACGACHDDVNFATGQNHVGGPQIDDNQCANCHFPQGELEFDASIKGAHLDPRFDPNLPGTTFQILSVTNTAAGQQPTVTFSVKDRAGNPIAASSMNSLSLVMAGPTTEYTSSFREDARKAQDLGNGQFSWTMQNAVPAGAAGSFSMAIEGYRSVTLLPNTTRATTVRDAGMNQITYFSVDGSPVQPRRQIVDVNKCNACHLQLSAHGGNRNQPDHCVQCHNPTATDAAGRPASAQPAQGINFRILIHGIHTGVNNTREFAIYGGSGSKTSFNNVLFPGDRRDCQKCHVNNSEQLPLPEGLPTVNNPRGLFNPAGPVTAACTACHTQKSVWAHALSMTSTLGESCDACHGSGTDFSIDKVHAR